MKEKPVILVRAMLLKENMRLEALDYLYETCPRREVSCDEPLVVFSDLHMGNGSRNDDFRHNGSLFCTVMEEYYGRHDYHLVLNGDVEDLQRFSLRSIVHRWRSVYHALAALAERGGLTRIAGNHDLEWLEGGPAVNFLAMFGRGDWPDLFIDSVHEALCLQCPVGDILIFHGHQTSWWYQNHNNVGRVLLRYLANPLHISSPNVAADSRKRFKVERRAYQFASNRKLLAIIGHTHRPLFESMSKADSVLFEIELLCRQYPSSDRPEEVESRVKELKDELVLIRESEEQERSHASLYREHLLVPCLFNSGTALGKWGITCLEIAGGKLRLVYWFDSTRKHRYRRFRELVPEPLPGTPYRRIVIKEESLSYIFTRIRLLT